MAIPLSYFLYGTLKGVFLTRGDCLQRAKAELLITCDVRGTAVLFSTQHDHYFIGGLPKCREKKLDLRSQVALPVLPFGGRIVSLLKGEWRFSESFDFNSIGLSYNFHLQYL